MGLLDHLWDETVAGPPPDSGPSRIHKPTSSSPSSRSAAATPGSLQVTRSITILRTGDAAIPPLSPSSASSSPHGSTWSALDSPISPSTPRRDWKRIRRKPQPVAVEREEASETRSPTVYDWMVISALDR